MGKYTMSATIRKLSQRLKTNTFWQMIALDSPRSDIVGCTSPPNWAHQVAGCTRWQCDPAFEFLGATGCAGGEEFGEPWALLRLAGKIFLRYQGDTIGV